MSSHPDVSCCYRRAPARPPAGWAPRLLCLAALLALSPALCAATLYDSTAGTHYGTGGPSDTWHYAERITPTQSGIITQISASLSGSGTINLAIRANNGGQPGALISSGSATVSGSGYVNVAMSPAYLSSSTQYWYVMSAPAGSSVGNHHSDLGTALWAFSTDGGASWTIMGGYTWLFSIEGTPNSAPVTVADSHSVSEDGTLSVAAPGVLSNDSDGDSDPLTAQLVSGPAHGSLTLNADGSFSYIPDPDYSGTDSFSYRAHDSYQAGNTVNVTLTVTAANDAPISVADVHVTNEDTPLNVAAPGLLANDSDVDGDTLTVQLVSGPAHGSLTLNADGSFSYTPDPDYHGADAFSYRAYDGTVYGNVVMVSLTVNPVNDAPVAVSDMHQGTEDTLLHINGGGVTVNDYDVDGDPFTVVLVSGPSHGTLTLQPNGSFDYMPDADFFGTDSFSYKLNDGSADSAVVAVILDILNVNDAPVAVADHYTSNEDQPLSSGVQGVLANDYDADGDSLAITMKTAPSHGTLVLKADGSFDYMPDADFFGTDSFDYEVQDPSGNTSAATVTIVIQPVNDAPYFTPGQDVSVNEDAGVVTVAGWAQGIDAGAGESGQILSFVVISMSEPGLFSGAVTISSQGELAFQTAQDACGVCDIAIQLQDDGGTANGGADTSAAYTLRIRISEINDAPSFSKGADIILQEDCGPQSFSGWATNISAGPANESGQTVGFKISSNNPSLFAYIQILANGTLEFEPATNAWGSAKLSVELYDDGGTANGGQDTSAGQQFEIVINPVNDAPSFVKGADVTVQEDSPAVTLSGWATSISSGPGNGVQNIQFVISQLNNVQLFAVAPSIDVFTGDLTFTLLPDAHGVAYFEVVLEEVTYGVNPASLASPTQHFKIAVLEVNDAPVFTPGANVQVKNNAGAISLSGWAQGMHSGAANEASQVLGFAVLANDNPGLFDVQPAVAQDGTLSFTVRRGAKGSAQISLVLMDDGGVANGGQDCSVPHTLAITVLEEEEEEAGCTTGQGSSWLVLAGLVCALAVAMRRRLCA